MQSPEPNLREKLDNVPDILQGEYVMFEVSFSSLTPHIIRKISENKFYVPKETISYCHLMRFSQLSNVLVVYAAHGHFCIGKRGKCSFRFFIKFHMIAWNCSMQELLFLGPCGK